MSKRIWIAVALVAGILAGSARAHEGELAIVSAASLIDDWDFDWQGTYFFETPPAVGDGERLRLECVYDNTAANPLNPSSPPRDVFAGERTVDEMCLAILFLTVEEAP